MRFTLILPLLLIALASSPSAQRRSEPDWERTSWLPPLFVTYVDGDNTKGSIFWPFFSWEHVGQDVEWSLRPIFGWQRNLEENRIRFDILWPLIAYDRDEQELDWRVFPVFGGWTINRQWGDPDRYFHIAPLFFSKRDPNRSSIWMLPFVRLREQESSGEMRFTGVLPFFVASDDRTQERTVSLFPVIWGREGDQLTEFHVFPLLWNWRHSSARFNAILPLWARYLDTDSRGGVRERHTGILPPLWVDSEWQGGEHWRHYILWPLIAWGRGPDSTILRFWPLFSHQRRPLSQPNSYGEDLYIFPILLARYFEDGVMFKRRFTTLLAWHWWGPDFGDRRATTWGLYPFVNGRSVEGVDEEFSVFDPLCFFDRTEVHNRLAVLWRLFHRWESADGSHLRSEALWRLYSRERDGEHTEMSVFPLFTNEQNSERSRTAILWRVFEITQEPEGRFVRILFSPRIRIGSGSEPRAAQSQ